jgi:hypothetical protein
MPCKGPSDNSPKSRSKLKTFTDLIKTSKLKCGSGEILNVHISQELVFRRALVLAGCRNDPLLHEILFVMKVNLFVVFSPQILWIVFHCTCLRHQQLYQLRRQSVYCWTFHRLKCCKKDFFSWCVWLC